MLDIVTVNWNSGTQLKHCVESVLEHSEGLVSKIIVVDNASTDQSVACIEGLPKVEIIYAPENLGFGKACNLGAKKISSNYVLFLNPDAEIYDGSLRTALDFMKAPENKDVAICGVQLINENKTVDRSCSRFPNLFNTLLKACGLDKAFPSMGIKMIEWDHETTKQVDQVIGAFFFVRASVFQELGGFDERFFVYFEEVDFSKRAEELGYKSFFLSDTQAFHSGGGVSQQVKALRLFYSWRSRILYFYKHFHFFTASLVLLLTILLEPFSRSVFLLLQFRLSAVLETWHALGMLLKWLPIWWFKGIFCK